MTISDLSQHTINLHIYACVYIHIYLQNHWDLSALRLYIYKYKYKVNANATADMDVVGLIVSLTICI